MPVLARSTRSAMSLRTNATVNGTPLASDALMKTPLAVALAAAAVLQAPFASGAPRAESAQECAIAADMAIVARSLAQERIDPDKANAIMTRVYDVAESERGKALMKDILEAAYKDQRPSQRFAEQLFSTCMKSAGNMDTVLGRRL